MKRSACAILVLAHSLAQAGNRVGNGGDVVHCKQPYKVALLDFYEVWRFKDPESGSDPKVIVEKKFEQLQKVAPSLATQYLKRAKNIMDEVEISDDVQPVEVKDSLHGFVPTGDCKVKQVALRMAEPPAGAKRFVFNKKFYGDLSASGKAGLIAHEIVYEHFNRLGHSDSRQVRKFVAYLFDKDFPKDDAAKFWEFMRGLKVPVYPEP